VLNVAETGHPDGKPHAVYICSNKAYLELAFNWFGKTIVIGYRLQFSDLIFAAYFASQ